MSNSMKLLLAPKHRALALVLSATILAVLVFKVNVRIHVPHGPQHTLVDRLGQVNWFILCGTFAFSALWHTVLGADKWWRILRAMGSRAGWIEVFRVRLGSDPIRFASPLKAGELVNAVYFGRLEAFGFSQAAGSIAFDKAINFIGTLVWLYIGTAALSRVPSFGHILLHTGMGAAILSVLAVRWPREMLRRTACHVHAKLGRLVTGILAAFEQFSLGQKVALVTYGVVFQLRPLIVCYLLFLAMSPRHMPSLVEFVAFGSVAVLMSNIPFTVAGIGPREAAIMALFAPYADRMTLLGVGVLMSFSIHVVPAIIGIPFMFGLLRTLAATQPAVGEVQTEPEGGDARAGLPVMPRAAAMTE
jgi:uncharacterized membrane protein YbhN (UPF0104 family)